MGALVLGYVSSRTVFFLAAAFVAVTAITALLIKHHGEKGNGKGHGGKYLHDHQGYKKMRNSQMLAVAGYQARAYEALDDDTNIDNVRTQIVNTISASTSDQTMLHNSIGQIVSEINSSAQAGGPLYTAISERRNGHIDANGFHDRIGEFVRQICAKHHIPIIRLPYGGNHARYGNLDYNDYIRKLLKRLGKSKGFQHHYPFTTYSPYVPVPVPAHTYTFPSYPTPYQNFNDISSPEPGLCNPNQVFNYSLGRCIAASSPFPDYAGPPQAGRVYGT
jgi:hypothetical protein